MRVINTIIHDGSGHILARESHSPGLLHIQIQTRLAISLASVLQIPLVGEVRVAGRLVAGKLPLQVVAGSVAALDSLVARLLLHALHQARLFGHEAQVDWGVAAGSYVGTLLVDKVVVEGWTANLNTHKIEFELKNQVSRLNLFFEKIKMILRIKNKNFFL